MNCGIYKIKCLKSNHYYIGSSCNIEKRFKRHMREAIRNRHHSLFFQNVFNKYGEENFILEILELCDKDYLKQREQYYLDNFLTSNAMNVSFFASGGDLLTENPRKLEIIAKRIETSKKRLGELSKEERKLKYGKNGTKNPMYGKTHTPEAVLKIKQAMKNRQPPSGWELDESHKKAISERQKLRTGAKNSFFGKHHTEEVRKLLSKKHKGMKPSNCRRVVIDGVTYDSATEAGRILNVCTSTILFRIKSKNIKFVNYFYLDKCLETIPEGSRP